MSKKINKAVPKADLASALRSNLLNRKKQLRARHQKPPNSDTEIVENNLDNVQDTTVIKDSL